MFLFFCESETSGTTRACDNLEAKFRLLTKSENQIN